MPGKIPNSENLSSKLCHMAIGCPGSGKSTLAKALFESDRNCRIVSSDRVRKKLFGNEAFQGSWKVIEAEILSEIEAHRSAGHSIIYDATNAVRPWRIDFLKKMQKYPDLRWVGWHLTTPLAVCQQWNERRERQVPARVIEEMHASLQESPPVLSEGFIAIYSIPYIQGKLEKGDSLASTWQQDRLGDRSPHHSLLRVDFS